MVDRVLRSKVTDTFLDEAQAWAAQSLTPEGYRLFTILIDEIHRLRRHVDGFQLKRSSQDVDPGHSPAPQRVQQCAFMRRIAGHQIQCTAQAKYGDFCGKHKPKKLRQQSKGCAAKNRAGVSCKALVLRDDFCPTHWRARFGHDYRRDGKGFRCSLCGATFDFWTVEGRGSDRVGSIRSLAKCPAKAQFNPP